MDGILVRIDQIKDSLTKAERLAADAILRNPESAVSRTITDFASFAGCSTASVSRLCRKLGLASFSELRVSVARAIAQDHRSSEDSRTPASFESLDSTSGILDYVTGNTISEIRLLRDILAEKSVTEAAGMIRDCRHIFTYGIGTSGLAAKDLKYKLSRLGIAAICDDDLDLMKVYLSSADAQDLIIFFSYSGATASVIELARIAREKGIRIISVTKIGRNMLSSLSDVVLHVPASESSFRESASLSRIMQLMVLDVLFNTLVLQMHNSIGSLVSTWDSVNQKERS